MDTEALRLIEMWNAQWCHHINSDDVMALLEAGRLMDFTHRPRTDEQREIVRKKLADGGNSWLPESNGYVPTPEEVNIWSLGVLTHDGCNQHVIVAAECARRGCSTTCVKCEGEGTLWPSPEVQKQAEEWAETEPPSGDGYQLWQTTSEGSPVSPVFPTIDELCEWGEWGATTFGSCRATAQEWRKMLDADLVYHSEGNNVFM
ncbi:MAG: hypothetical protein ACRCWR_06215 [Saezia sp.]